MEITDRFPAVDDLSENRISLEERIPGAPYQSLYLTIFILWLISLIWFTPRLIGLIEITNGPISLVAVIFFIIFVELAWLYGFYNICVVVFARIYKGLAAKRKDPLLFCPVNPPAIALLYTTFNDFVESSAESCVKQDYPAFTVYILDDSTDPVYKGRVDTFAAKYPGLVRVVRRLDRRGFKAGNLNHALSTVARFEPFFALADADEVLPSDFLRRLVPHLLVEPGFGFVQANHRHRPDSSSQLARAMGIGIDSHWRWYQPLRNRYGFVMLLGHGAVLRRSCWEKVGGFPEVVSEDLAYAIRIREEGWRGYFVEEVICYEDFPDSIQAFRIRHMKWTRGTCELLAKELGGLIRSNKISLVEKLDILFPTLNLPLSLFYFLFLIDANLFLPALFGHRQTLTLMLGGYELTLPTWVLDPGFRVLSGTDFFLVTTLTLLAPILCFVIDLVPRPLQLYRFLCRSTSIYAALSPISSLGVLSYLITGKATFLVTGDRGSYSYRKEGARGQTLFKRFFNGLQRLFWWSHPDDRRVQAFEILSGVILGFTSLFLAQLSCFGLSIALILFPVMHRVSWEHPAIQRLIHLPILFILAGVLLGGINLFGIQPAFFGYGFHF